MEKEKTLATELMHELKMSAKRWFYAFIIMCCLEVGTIGGFLWYISLPVDDVTVESDDNGNANFIGNDLNGVLNNGKDKENTESNKK